ncbi:MAG: hypothetical protein ACKOE5_03550 [Cytophagales bacterium]
MRLAQLARKLSVKQSEVVAFLANQNISIADNSNARVEEEHMRLVIQNFAPHLMEEVFAQEAEEQASPEPVVENASEETFEQEVEVVAEARQEVTELSGAFVPEVIKAQKVELQGLKVLGKIELPEPKKKEGTEQKAENRPARERREKKSFERREKHNPIALQREREEREAEQRRQEKLKAEKELKTKRYLNKVKSQTAKPVKLVKEEVEEMRFEEEPQPNSLLGRFWKWLRT